MTRSMSSKLERSASRRIPFELGKDEEGPFIGYCPYHKHPQIVGNGELVKCLKQRCYHLVIFRPEGSVPKKGMILELNIVPNKEIYKTEYQRKNAEERLRAIEGTLIPVTQKYIQLGLKEGHKFCYDVDISPFYPENQRDLECCPLHEYPKQKKEKGKKGGRKKLSERK